MHRRPQGAGLGQVPQVDMLWAPVLLLSAVLVMTGQ